MEIYDYIFAYDLKDGETDRYTEIIDYLKEQYHYKELNKSVHFIFSEHSISKIEHDLAPKLRSEDYADLIFVNNVPSIEHLRLQIKRLNKSKRGYNYFCDYVLIYDIENEDEREKIQKTLESKDEFKANRLSNSVYQFDSKKSIEAISRKVSRLFKESVNNKVYLIYGEDYHERNLVYKRIKGK